MPAFNLINLLQDLTLHKLLTVCTYFSVIYAKDIYQYQMYTTRFFRGTDDDTDTEKVNIYTGILDNQSTFSS